MLSGRVLLHPQDPVITTAFHRDTLDLVVYREFPRTASGAAGNGVRAPLR